MAVAKMPTQAERLAALETSSALLSVQVQNIDAKLDNLLALRDRGLGAFWLASALLGTSFVGFITMMLGWFHK